MQEEKGWHNTWGEVLGCLCQPPSSHTLICPTTGVPGEVLGSHKGLMLKTNGPSVPRAEGVSSRCKLGSLIKLGQS